MKIQVRKDLQKHINNAKKFKKDFKVRTGNNFSEIFMTHANQRLLFNDESQFNKGLFLFKMVRTDIETYIQENGEVTPLDELPVNFTNTDYRTSQKTIGVDLDHAYWRVAYLKGYIQKKTYEKGLASKHYKAIRLSALSSLGRKKVYDVYVQGDFKHQEVVGEIPYLVDLYNDIRYTTFSIMKEVADLLGEDFYCWRTDCIYFKDLKRNRKLVTETFDSYDLLWKWEEA